MKTRKNRYFACDFETTVYANQINTEVWAAASVELFTDAVSIFHSIDEQFEYFKSLKCNIVAYYHNLKFDGAFWLSYLMVDLGYKQAAYHPSTGSEDFSNDEEDADDFKFYKQWEMPAKSFVYSISDMGQWYRIIIKLSQDHYLEIRDSLKLLPFSVKRIGESFKTKHKKLDMEYTGFRYAGCNITDDEKHYIANDVLVIKEALEIMFEENHKQLTIGSCCLSEFKKTIPQNCYDDWFPNLYEYELGKEFGVGKKDKDGNWINGSIGDYIRKSYRGGWCYLVHGKEKQMYHNGTTADVNSLYPSMMHSESGNKFPVGLPTFWRGNLIPDEAIGFDKYYFVRVKTKFYLKDNMLPFIQIKHSPFYKSTESLISSDVPILDEKGKPTGEWTDKYIDFDGSLKQADVTMTLTCTDFELMLEHYDLVGFEILDGCWFNARIGLFDIYIDKYKKQKLEYTGARKELAKLFLNNLYGKTASSPASNFKVAYLKDDNSIGFYQVNANDKTPGYIPVGSAITSYARNFTIRAAQKNYHGLGKRGFIYADTDSIHCDLKPEEIVGIKVHDKDFCCWKLESCWDDAYFVRQKTYVEHITHENCVPVEQLDKEPFYNIKCAGMPQKCKDLFLLSLGENTDLKELSFEELKFCVENRTISNFDIGLKVPGKLLPKRILGGIVLVDTMYEMR